MTEQKHLYERCCEAGIPVRRDVALSTLTHWRIGGPADVMAEPRTAEDVLFLRNTAMEEGVPFLVIGHGSNLLFDDEGYRGLIVRIGSKMSACSIGDTKVTAEAGIWAPALARMCASRGLSGIEHIVGIPGNLGGLVFMNGGSLRRNIGDVVESVSVLTPAGELKTVLRDDCGFGYRTSVFQSDGSIVLGAVLNLKPSSPDRVRADMLDILAERRGKFPLNLPNCGSVFSNDSDLYESYGPPGMVIDRMGLKGTTYGGAQISSVHGNFIVNLGNASSADVFSLIRKIRAQVFGATGFYLHCEVRYVAPDGKTGRLHEFL